MKYAFLSPLPNTQEIYRTKQGVLTCKVFSYLFLGKMLNTKMKFRSIVDEHLWFGIVEENRLTCKFIVIGGVELSIYRFQAHIFLYLYFNK